MPGHWRSGPRGSNRLSQRFGGGDRWHCPGSRPSSHVIDRAHALIGTPYKGGGTSVEQGFDCSSFLVYLFKTEANIRLPRTTAAMHR